jgi:hypothetical protein
LSFSVRAERVARFTNNRSDCGERIEDGQGALRENCGGKFAKCEKLGRERSLKVFLD